MKKKIHRNIPIFIPHLGCPNMCVFCNQRSISGVNAFDRENVRRQIEDALATIDPSCEVEIAYFGGSFTGIDRELMIYLLDLAQGFIDREDDGYACVCGIRMSTRPDYINGEILDILSGYSVKTIELGLQSMDDNVLRLSRRGHDAECAERACREIVERGYDLVGQMMIGLPGSTIADERETARKIVSLGAVGARIYPTVTFYDTELCEMARSGEYEMITNEEAIARSKEAYAIFRDAGVECIRIGLCASDNLGDLSKVMGGANHPAMGELVIGEYYFDRMCELLDIFGDNTRGRIAVFAVLQGDVSKAVGQQRKNTRRLCSKYGLRKVIIKETRCEKIELIALQDGEGGK